VRPRMRPVGAIGDPLTVDMVRELLWAAKVLAPDERLPAAAEARLTGRLNVAHYFFSIDEAIRPANAAKREAIASIETARRALAKLADREREFLASAEAAATANPKYVIAKMSAEAKRDHLEQIALIDGLLGYVRGLPVLKVQYSSGRAQKWASQADLLFDELREALSAIPGRPLGLSNRAARFLAAVVPLLTGERITVGAAKKRLQRLRDERRSEADALRAAMEAPDVAEADDDCPVLERA
jgi:hypothetical protein